MSDLRAKTLISLILKEILSFPERLEPFLQLNPVKSYGSVHDTHCTQFVMKDLKVPIVKHGVFFQKVRLVPAISASNANFPPQETKIDVFELGPYTPGCT